MDHLILPLPASLNEALAKIQKSGEGIVFVTKGGILVGSITDGDVRRHLLEGTPISSDAELFLNSNTKKLNVGCSPIETYKAFTPAITHIPIVDSNGVIVEIITPQTDSAIPLCEPNLGLEESQLVNVALKSGWISSAGAFVDQFETSFSEYVGSNHALSVSNGTLGLVLALKLVGIEPGDEVLIPDLTFGATANAVVQVGAVPVFVDVTRESFAIDLNLAEKKITSKTKAIIPVHLYGNAAPMREILKFAEKYGLYVIEDAAEAIGTLDSNRHVGTYGHIGVFSFYGNKTITTGEGGMVVFDNPELLRKAKMMRSHGFSPEKRYWHETWGTNFRLTNLQAAIGVAQVAKIESLVLKKIQIAESYKQALLPSLGNLINFPVTRNGVRNSHWLSVLLLESSEKVDPLLEFLSSNRVETRKFFPPLHLQPAFAEYVKPEDLFPISTDLSIHGICLPSSTTITPSEIMKVANLIIEFLLRD